MEMYLADAGSGLRCSVEYMPEIIIMGIGLRHNSTEMGNEIF